MLWQSLGWHIHAHEKPSEFGVILLLQEVYSHYSISLRGCQRNFTYVNAGRPGSVGDLYNYRHSIMFQKNASGEWLAHSSRTISGVNVKPFILADSAFPLSSMCMKCYEVGQPAYRCSFNCSLIHTRRVVEQAFGRLKGHWKIMDRNCSLRTQCSSDKWQWCPVPI